MVYFVALAVYPQGFVDLNVVKFEFGAQTTQFLPYRIQPKPVLVVTLSYRVFGFFPVNVEHFFLFEGIRAFFSHIIRRKLEVN